ncbi:MAG: hypothetical protein JO296_05435 [Pseudonocardiales bacterium]|nr:hypothetical protein [Pseudonocardiales bacterium]
MGRVLGDPAQVRCWVLDRGSTGQGVARQDGEQSLDESPAAGVPQVQHQKPAEPPQQAAGQRRQEVVPPPVGEPRLAAVVLQPVAERGPGSAAVPRRAG